MLARRILGPFLVLEVRLRLERGLVVAARPFDEAHLLVDHAAAGVGGRIVRIERDRLVVAVDRVLILVLHRIGVAAVAVGELQPFRLERDRLVEVGDRAVVVVLLVIVLAAADIGVADLVARRPRRGDDAGAGVDRVRAAADADVVVVAHIGRRRGRRRRGLARRIGGRGQLVEMLAGGILSPLLVLEGRLRPQRGVVVVARLVDLADLLVEQPAPGEGGRIVLVERDRDAVAVDRPVVVALHRIGVAAVAVGKLDVARLVRHRLVEILDRAVVVVLLVVVLAAADIGVADLVARRLRRGDDPGAGVDRVGAAADAGVVIGGRGVARRGRLARRRLARPARARVEIGEVPLRRVLGPLLV